MMTAHRREMMMLEKVTLDKPSMTDIQKAAQVELLADRTGKVWINVDGRCILRFITAESVRLEVNGKEQLIDTGYEAPPMPTKVQSGAITHHPVADRPWPKTGSGVKSRERFVKAAVHPYGVERPPVSSVERDIINISGDEAEIGEAVVVATEKAWKNGYDPAIEPFCVVVTFQ